MVPSIFWRGRSSMFSLGRSAKVVAATIALTAIISAQLITMPVASAQGVTIASSPQPPNNVDHAAFSAAELDLYGLPPYRPGQSLSQWQQVVRAAKTHICTGHRHQYHIIPSGIPGFPPQAAMNRCRIGRAISRLTGAIKRHSGSGTFPV